MSDPNSNPSQEAKPADSKTPKTKAAKAPAASGSEKTLPPLINPAWVAEVVKSYGLVGKPGENVAAALSTAIEKQLAKATRPEKLDKLVLGAMAEAIRKRGA